jgi:hypothetical protein
MKFSRRDQMILGMIALTWATLPLAIHFLLPRHEEHTGTVMIVGMMVAAVAVYRLSRSIARRLDLECRERLAAQGFQVVPLDPGWFNDWVPTEHQRTMQARFDGFLSADQPRWPEGYQRVRNGLRCHLFGYHAGKESLVAALRVECREWVWPEFSCSVRSRWLPSHLNPGWERISFDADPAFSAACMLQAPRPAPVRALWDSAARRLLLDHPSLRIHAAGPVLTVYSHAFRLIPDEAEAFLQQAEAVVAHWHSRSG